MKEQLMKIKEKALEALLLAKDLSEIESVKNQYLSKKGEISLLMGELRNLDPSERPAFGQMVNQLKVEVEQALYDKKSILEEEALLASLKNEKIDVTLPGVKLYEGSIHPLNQVIEDVEDFFIGLGYEVAEGPELENDHYNFEMMNLDKDHPARAMQDTFYTDETHLLRTHTSPVQARTMLAKKGQPLRIICPGKVYRRDDDDPTHSHQFMQIEGLVIDHHIQFANLKDVLLKMAQHLFGKERMIRLRPSYFPFTEPSVEVDVSYVKKDGSIGYIEVLGAGQVHPNVLKMGGYDPHEFQGFAFGIGVERIAILKYAIDDIRHFYQNDLRFLDQFKGVNR
ncbi:MAG: phenylalanine--tRNA ligase subunit alpha [Acholeplasmataceae bacterium]|jgi:phenylalanyl-tRNA synthetase alpha chain|nr:phenylalanine--tRNA ligase subunit alpha [Acholeplasmataceae bacterium]MDY0339250.1 phenylalanine--tRNA ligase subunit alpha [Acholeplasmataceae bacterium]